MGGAVRTNKTFALFMNRYKGQHAVIVNCRDFGQSTQRLLMHHSRRALLFLTNRGAAGTLPTARLTSCPLFHTGALLNLCSNLSTKSAALFGAGRSDTRLQLKIQLKENNSLWYLLLCPP